ncbi:hypothetical protein [Modestobacter roseus]|uniref:hypothetical protein n=1 Tax=Modestobacter roseus TaxID=1181884 RepID=UPI0012962C93|nr:hypothetical protein [Modestobacter roseus]MQA35284.1 hypothetical protein [Modestobacter roseus]
MTVTSTDLRDVGTLISCALRPKLRPAADTSYRQLLARYRTEVEFRTATGFVLDGMDLVVLSDAADLGLILGPRRESLFAARLADVPNVAGVEQRLLVGLITAGVAAYAYPTADAFDDDRVRYVRVEDLERFLRETCEHLKREADAPLDDEGLEEAWRVYERMPAVRRAEKGRTTGRLSPACTTYWVGNVLQWLTEQGLARLAERQGPDTYHLLERFRVQVREMSGHEAYKLLADARSRDSGLDATLPPVPPVDPDDVIDLSDTSNTDTAGTYDGMTP